MPSPEYFVDLARRLTDAPHGGKGAIIEDAIRACGNRAAVYRGLQQHAGWQSGRKTRRDTGESLLEQEEAVYLAGYINAMNRKNGKQIITVEQAVQDLRANGQISKDFSVSTARRALENLSATPRQMRNPAPVQRLRSLHPNHVHQVDPSVCVLYYLGENARFEWQNEHVYYKNKPANQDTARAGMLWRYVLTDHTTGYIEPLYIRAAGESFINYFDALTYFWGRKSHTPFHGVPKFLVSDRIGAMKTAEMQSLLTALEVEHIVAQGARAKGQVESANNLIETHFEYRLRGQNVRSVEHLNEMAAAWSAWFNGTQHHRRYGTTRTEFWLENIREEHIRLLPDIAVCRLLAEPRKHLRTVTPDMAVTFAWPAGIGQKTYRLRHIPGLNVRDKVAVQPAPFDAPALWVTVTATDGTESRHLVKPIETDKFGFDREAAVIGDAHKQVAADTPREALRKQFLKQAHGTDTLAEAEAAQKKNAPVYQGQVDTMRVVQDAPKIAHMPRRGMEIRPAVELPRNSPMHSMIGLSNRLGRPLTAPEGEELRRGYPAGCTDAELDDLAARMRGAGVKLSAVGG